MPSALVCKAAGPGVETPGYCRWFLRNRRRVAEISSAFKKVLNPFPLLVKKSQGDERSRKGTLSCHRGRKRVHRDFGNFFHCECRPKRQRAGALQDASRIREQPPFALVSRSAAALRRFLHRYFQTFAFLTRSCRAIRASLCQPLRPGYPNPKPKTQNSNQSRSRNLFCHNVS